MNGFERRKQKKIEQIYSKAFQLFAEHGFQRVSVNEIAQQAKVSPATIYNYFGTKEQLYADMLIDWMDRQLEHYEGILDSERSFPEKAREIMLHEVSNLKILSDEFQQVPSSDRSGLMGMIESYSEQKIRGFFMKFVAAGKHEGYIREDLTEEMMLLYFNMYKNELGRYWESSEQEPENRNIDHLMELFFYGLVGGGGG
ncbi:TetR/AcrR family transcriptional regulator [Paenibacillus oenotherae]|uniref:TetR/AcrR family transcriptional regulator n=1 Tax=Paenibacillus oenotherae TaxID=1435645 RepID=A0ABS7DBQ7_9BACL|nr:TetR/AcrR family transcriptional regulator [Paenibacillus oenotherae]MBW7477325.1 TetR/AcrR family transcriptional regulator [Paenibacillus oenotherae]